jgi:heptaprenyl diphosphate synthase
LGSFCLFLSTLEYLIPKPLPFMRIGLANLPLMLALDLFPPGAFALLVLIKITGQALITGTLFSYVFLFSLAGSSVSAAAMYSLRRLLGKSRIGFTGIGISGAVLSNLVQLILARFFIFGGGVRFLAPLFLASGLISGGGLGLFCETFAARSRWYRRVSEKNGAGISSAGNEGGGAGDLATGPDAAAPAWPAAVKAGAPPGGQGPDNADEGPGGAGRKRSTGRLRRRERWNRLFRSEDLFITGLVIMLIFLFTSSLIFKTLQLLFFGLLTELSGKKTRPLAALLIITGIVFCNLLVPYGRVLAQAGPLAITQGALLAGLRRALTLEGLIMLSGAFIRADLRLPGAFGVLLGESFRIFGALQERKTVFTRGHIVEGIDELMLELDRDTAQETPAHGGPGKRNPLSGVHGKTEALRPVRRHPASLPLLAAITLASVLLALAGEEAVLKWAGELLGPDPGQARAGFLITGVKPEGPFIGFNSGIFIAGGFPDGGEPVPPEGKTRLKPHRGSIGNIRVAVPLPQSENLPDKKISHRNPFPLGQDVCVTLHKI